MQVKIDTLKNISLQTKKSAVRFLIYFALALIVSRVRLLGNMMPFGAAFCSAAYIARRHVNLGAVMLGAIAGNFIMWQEGSLAHIVLISLLCGGLCAISFIRLKSERPLAVMVTAAVYLLCGVIFMGGDSLKLIMWLFEAAIAVIMIFVFGAAFRLKSGDKIRSVLFDEEIISVAFVCLCVVLGLSDVALFGVYIRDIAAILISLIAAYTGGCAVGGAVGLVIGFGILLCGGHPYFMCALAMGAFCAGLLNKTYRIFSGASLLLINAIMTFYIKEAEGMPISLIGNIIGIGIFCILPQRFLEHISSFVDANVSRMRSQKMNIKRFRELTVGRLYEVADVFLKASGVFLKDTEDKNDFLYVLENVRGKTCENCERYIGCWSGNKRAEKEIKKAYIEYKTGASENFGKGFAPFCVKERALKEVIKNVFYVYDSTKNVMDKMSASKKIVGEQLRGVSKVIVGLGKEFDADIRFSGETEKVLRCRLETAGIRPYEISVENEQGEYGVFIKIKSCGGRRICENKIEDIISNTVGIKMEKEKALCQMTDRYCSLSFVRKKKISVNACALSMPKKGNDVCGDSHIINSFKDGRFMLLLCDGMGNGRKAKNRSDAAAKLMNTFYKAGFDDSTIISSINKLLLLSSREDTYSTMDLCMIDRNKGEAIFTKTGSPPAFIFRKGGVITIEGEALPVGIVDEVKPSKRSVELFDGDIIVLLSDGISDIAVDTARFIKNCINSCDISKLPGEIISSAMEICGGYAPDDMTVIAAKIRSN